MGIRTLPEGPETDRKRAASKAYYERTRESRKAKRNQTSRNYYHRVLRNRPGFMEQQAKYSRESHSKARVQCIEHLGGRCCKCGFDDYRALQIDHANGGGVKELSTTMYYKYMAKVLATEPGTEYQLLCANCNWIKRHENNEVPGRPVIIDLR